MTAAEAAARRAAARLVGAVDGAVLLRGGPAPVLRVPGHGILRTSPAGPDGLAAAARVAAAATSLAAAGAPVVVPRSAPIAAEGLVAVLWEEVADDGPRDRLAAGLGVALGRLHLAGADLLHRGAVDLPDWDPAASLESRLAALDDGRPPPWADELRHLLAAVTPLRGTDRTVLHTDAHAGNACLSRDGDVTLIDLDGLSVGPALYDLAPFAVTERRLGARTDRFAAVRAAYDRETARRGRAPLSGTPPDRDAELEQSIAVREILAVAWVAGRGEEGRREAERRLADVRGGRPGRWRPVV